MSLLLLRCFFILSASGVGVYLVQTGIADFWGFVGLMFLTLTIIGGDLLFPRKKVDLISSVYFGLLVGLFLTYVLSLAVFPLFEGGSPEQEANIRRAIMLTVGLPVCYLCISVLLQTRNDFRFIIPYVEFQKNLRGNRPLILDTSVVIDGRIADVMETMIIDSRLILPRFAITELQRIADSADRGRRTRGRRGLDILNRLQKMKGVDLQIDDSDLPAFRGQPVDLKLVALTKHLEGRLVTNDYNLNKIAKLQGVDVINLNDLAGALKPIFSPGDKLDVEIVKPGEEVSQGIGYLDDGTMVVVDNGREHLAERAVVTVTSVLQTSAGRMIFGRYEYATKSLSYATNLSSSVAFSSTSTSSLLSATQSRATDDAEEGGEMVLERSCSSEMNTSKYTRTGTQKYQKTNSKHKK